MRNWKSMSKISIHESSSQYTGGLSFSTRIDGHEVITDTKESEGGQNLGPSPKKLMLASLAGCTGIDIAMILHKMKVEFENLNIDIRAELTDIHPSTYQSVHIIYSLRVNPGDEDKMRRAVKLSDEKYCGVMHMFRKFAKVTHEVRFLP